jgi:hypothetical protein
MATVRIETETKVTLVLSGPEALWLRELVFSSPTLSDDSRIRQCILDALDQMSSSLLPELYWSLE